MDWKEVYARSRPAIRGSAMGRGWGVSGIGAFILLVSALLMPPGWALAASFGLVLAIVAAFWREAWHNIHEPALVLVGRVTDTGWRKFTDSGGPGDGPAFRVGVSPRTTIEVSEAFALAPDGTRTPRPDQQKTHVIEQLRWLREVEPGEEVTLVCLPRSTDPVYKVPR